jgi:hypothetical protein
MPVHVQTLRSVCVSADRLNLAATLRSAIPIFVLFAAVSFLSSPIPGVNEPHYLTKARAFAEPDWCARDFFLSSGNAHYCFFWIIGLLTRFFSFLQIAVLGRIVSSGLLAFGWSELGRSLHLRSSQQILSASVFASVSLLGNFSGEWLLGGFESKVPAWGLGLAAIGCWIRSTNSASVRPTAMAGILCGLASSLHPVVGGWLAICLCTVMSCSSVRSLFVSGSAFRIQIRHLCVFASLTLILALPGLVPAVRFVLDQSLLKSQQDLANYVQVFWRLRHHLDPAELSQAQWGFAGVVSLWTMFNLRMIHRALKVTINRQSPDSKSPPATVADISCRVHRLVFVLAVAAVIALIGIAIGWHTIPAKQMPDWQWRAALLKFYPFRCFDGLLPITLAFLQSVLLQLWTDSDAFLKSTVARMAHQKSIRVSLLIAAFAVPCLLGWRYREVSPAGYTRAQFLEWRQACDWLRENTPRDALILTPRESFAFKWFAERAEYVCYKDCPQDAVGILEWNSRLWLLHDWTEASSGDGLYGDDDLTRIWQLTECDYLLTRTLGPFESTPVWSGKEWKIVPLSNTGREPGP